MSKTGPTASSAANSNCSPTSRSSAPASRCCLPKGATVRRILETFITDYERKAGYQHVYTPDIAKKELYIQSGHWEHYKDSMFPPMDLGEEAGRRRPRACGRCAARTTSRCTRAKPRSYRDLPIRIAELGTMYRYEQSGVVGGLSRVRCMTLNDAHLFVRPDQVKSEIAGVLSLMKKAYADLGITEYRFRLSKHDPADKEKYVDNPAMWESSIAMLREALQESGLPFFEADGEAAFYGPKIDVQVKDVMGREETLSTIQVDQHLPEQFKLEYKDADDTPKRPVMIHRGVISTMERMMAYLIELYAGAFPVWLAPVQVAIVPIADRHFEFAQKLADDLLAKDFRVEADLSDKRMNAKIREAQMQKVPYILVIGDKEMAANAVAVRLRDRRGPRREAGRGVRGDAGAGRNDRARWGWCRTHESSCVSRTGARWSSVLFIGLAAIIVGACKPYDNGPPIRRWGGLPHLDLRLSERRHILLLVRGATGRRRAPPTRPRGVAVHVQVPARCRAHPPAGDGASSPIRR